ncbi:MAG: hypothetical protein CM15mP109_13220 [Candidatus Dadabacteria bacterium]|nr:MAG: hypothetical protein CM15mP109_13220 [Candidatus Dadabacteria bacterium]
MLNNILLKLGRVWFYFLAGIQVVVYFPFLVVILLLPKGIQFYFGLQEIYGLELFFMDVGIMSKLKI